MAFSFNFSGDDIDHDEVTTEVSARAAALSLQNETASGTEVSAEEEAKPKRENIKELVSCSMSCMMCSRMLLL